MLFSRFFHEAYLQLVKWWCTYCYLIYWTVTLVVINCLWFQLTVTDSSVHNDSWTCCMLSLSQRQSKITSFNVCEYPWLILHSKAWSIQLVKGVKRTITGCYKNTRITKLKSLFNCLFICLFERAWNLWNYWFDLKKCFCVGQSIYCGRF